MEEARVINYAGKQKVFNKKQVEDLLNLFDARLEDVPEREFSDEEIAEIYDDPDRAY